MHPNRLTNRVCFDDRPDLAIIFPLSYSFCSWIVAAIANTSGVSPVASSPIHFETRYELDTWIDLERDVD